MFQWLPTFQSIAGLVLAFVAYSWRRPNLPPSPPASYIPRIGHALLLADTRSVISTKFDRWAKELGPIFSLNVMGETMIVLSSYKVVKELLEGRGAIYSGRKQLALVGKYITSNANMAFIDYDDAWRAQRKATARELNTNNSKQYRNIQEREGYMLALSFLRQPNDIWDISYRFAGSVSLAAVYDYRVKDTYDENIVAWRHNLHDTLNLLVPGVSYYDSLPYLRWLPESIMTSKRTARQVKNRINVVYRKLSKFVEDRLARDEDTSCFHAGLLRREAEGKQEFSPFVRDALSGTLMGGALDTTAVTTHNLILSLVAHQGAQAKVQEEVDRVVGRSRLPNKEDLPKLHYCRAFVAESQRFRGTARAGVPHRLEQDDVYEGYFLPKGSTVIANAWTMSFDPEYFPDPHAFKPERYLARDGTYDSSVLVVDFGFGRRICPGVALAVFSLSSAVACLAWAFHVVPGKDAEGNVIQPDLSPDAYTDAGLVFPAKPFAYEVIQRDDKVASIIEDTVAAAFASGA